MIVGSDTKSAKCNLTQRSRLLDEIEKQRIENKLNRNTTEPSNTLEIVKADEDMETDDNNQSAVNKPVESDLGIECMDTDELPLQSTNEVVPKQVIVENLLSDESKQTEAEICLSRILDAFWYDHCEGQIIVTETAAMYKDLVIDEKNPIHFDNLAFEIIVEIILQYFDGKQIDFKASSSDPASTKLGSFGIGSDAANDTERMDTSDLNCMAPNMMPHNLPDQGALTFIMQSYVRACNEHERYNTTKNQAKFGSVVVDVIEMAKKELITSTKLLLSGKIVKQLPKNAQLPRLNQSVLLKMMYDDAVPSDFLCCLVDESYKDEKIFETIFGSVVQNLYFDMQSRIIGKNIDMAPINVLKQLLEIQISNGTRPITNLVTSQPNFYPTLCTDSHGREIAKVSYLGPFLSLSVFSEENPKLAEDVDDNWESEFGTGLRIVCVKFDILF